MLTTARDALAALVRIADCSKRHFEVLFDSLHNWVYKPPQHSESSYRQATLKSNFPRSSIKGHDRDEDFQPPDMAICSLRLRNR